jgi:hypothetical protein
MTQLLHVVKPPAETNRCIARILSYADYVALAYMSDYLYIHKYSRQPQKSLLLHT